MLFRLVENSFHLLYKEGKYSRKLLFILFFPLMLFNLFYVQLFDDDSCFFSNTWQVNFVLLSWIKFCKIMNVVSGIQRKHK